MLLYLTLQALNHLHGVSKLGMTENIQHVIIAKANQIGVLGLVQTIGRDEERLTLDAIDILTLELEALPVERRNQPASGRPSG